MEWHEVFGPGKFLLLGAILDNTVSSDQRRTFPRSSRELLEASSVWLRKNRSPTWRPNGLLIKCLLCSVRCQLLNRIFMVFFIGSLLFAFAIHLDSFPRFNKGKLSFKAGYFALAHGRFFNMINVESIEQSSQAKLQLILIFSLWNTIFNPLVWSCSHVWLEAFYLVVQYFYRLQSAFHVWFHKSWCEMCAVDWKVIIGTLSPERNRKLRS